jgi:hypothetical protein
MAISAVLRDALKAAPTVNDPVGGRIYRDERPQGDPLPAIVIQLISDPRPLTFSGLQSVRRARLQVDCLATRRGVADDLAEAVIAAIDGRALAALPEVESARVVDVRNDSSRDSPATTFRTAIDVMVWHYPSN